jgi:cellulose synthase/poly-beta-1,6-N-acetylglucosamine synthase-like glycosyltransferase
MLTFHTLSNKKILLSTPAEIPEADYAIVITAYQYVNTLPAVVTSVLSLNYKNYLVYIVADNCDTSTLNFTDDRIILLKPEQVLAGNIKSHFYAIENFKRQHERITIIDSDNLIHPDYLNQLNIFFKNGFEAVQGCREAKNLDTTYACLDAARDIYYHYYDCKLLFNLGSSSTLSGSGMAFTTQLYKNCLGTTEISGAGFDKVLQKLIVEKNKRIAFAPGALVYDEKTARPQELVNQRARWINTWFKYFKFGFALVFKGIKNASLNQFLFGLTLLRPPLFLFLISSVIMMILNFIYYPLLGFLWLAALMVFIICFITALVASKPDKRIYSSLIGIPKFIFYQLISLSNVRKANTRSVSTRHYHT